MFNWFKKETAQEKLSREERQQLDYYLKSKEDEPERTYYSVGPTTEGRVMLKVYYGNISFTEDGIDYLIKALETSKMWLTDDNRRPENRAPEVPEEV